MPEVEVCTKYLCWPFYRESHAVRAVKKLMEPGTVLYFCSHCLVI